MDAFKFKLLSNLFYIFISVFLFFSCDNPNAIVIDNTCNNQCSEKGVFCIGKTIVSCSMDDKKCYIKSIIKECGDKEICNQGECVDDCSNQCDTSGYSCKDNKRYECGYFNDDTCFDEKEAFCEDNEHCDNGECVLNCVETENGIEICDGIDNDCDGSIDEDLAIPDADKTQGLCSGQVKVCSGIDKWKEPDYTIITDYEVNETTCDGLDNDCDGEIDEDLTPSANKTQGVCLGQKKLCKDGEWIEPDYTKIDKYEEEETTCDGLDNDCDNEVDEGAPRDDYDGDGILDCGDNCFYKANSDQNNLDGDNLGSACDCYDNNSNIELQEICDGVDNNCNGLIDEGNICFTPDCTLKTYNNHSYLFCSNLEKWSNARKFCNNINYNLVTIETIEENNWIIENKEVGKGYWIGLNDIIFENLFKWESGIINSYYDWDSSEPNNDGNQDCVRILPEASSTNNSLSWDDDYCNLEKMFICERNYDFPITKTTASSCKEILENDNNASSGIYYINKGTEEDVKPVLVLCDMLTDGGGWTLVASWNRDYRWTKGNLSKNSYFGFVTKDTVSSNFGDMVINDFRVTAADNLLSIMSDVNTNGIIADWYYHYDTELEWKKVWAPGEYNSDANASNCDNGYMSAGAGANRQSLKEFDYSYNIKHGYKNNSHKWNNLSDWSPCSNIANYWGALTTKGIDFGIYNYNSVHDGTLGILIKGNTGLKSGHDISANYSALVGYDDGDKHASYGTSESQISTYGDDSNNINESTKLWWWVR